MTSAHQPLNEGKAFVLKIKPGVFFEEVKPSKEYIKRIDLKHRLIYGLIQERKWQANKGFDQYLNLEEIKRTITHKLTAKKTCEQKYPQSSLHAMANFGKIQQMNQVKERKQMVVVGQAEREQSDSDLDK